MKNHKKFFLRWLCIPVTCLFFQLIFIFMGSNALTENIYSVIRIIILVCLPLVAVYMMRPEEDYTIANSLYFMKKRFLKNGLEFDDLPNEGKKEYLTFGKVGRKLVHYIHQEHKKYSRYKGSWYTHTDIFWLSKIDDLTDPSFEASKSEGTFILLAVNSFFVIFWLGLNIFFPLKSIAFEFTCLSILFIYLKAYIAIVIFSIICLAAKNLMDNKYESMNKIMEFKVYAKSLGVENDFTELTKFILNRNADYAFELSVLSKLKAGLFKVFFKRVNLADIVQLNQNPKMEASAKLQQVKKDLVNYYENRTPVLLNNFGFATSLTVCAAILVFSWITIM